MVLASRDLGRGQAAVQKLEKELNCQGRLELVQLDTCDADSIAAAASVGPLFGLVNNAGVKSNFRDTMDTNYWGVRKVCDALVPLVQKQGGRVVNVCSAAGPNFVAKLPETDPLRDQLAKPWTVPSVDALDAIVKNNKVKDESAESWDSYGLSKASLMAYTYLLSRANPDMIINGVTPGFIATDLTAGMGASNAPAKGAEPVLHCLFSDEVASAPQGRYYGSDGKRSPLHVYRGPGDPVYDGPDGPE